MAPLRGEFTASHRVAARRGRLALLVVALSVLCAVACGGASPTRHIVGAALSKEAFTAELAKPASLTFWTWLPGVEKEVELFERAHPHIDVDVVNVGMGVPHCQKLRTALRAGKGAPDVAQLEFQYIPSYVLTKSLLDLSRLFAVDEFRARYPEWVADQVVSDGAVWAVPQDTGPMGLLYRQDLLEEAGIQPPETWDEFARAARAYRAKHPGRYLANMPPNAQPQWIGLFWQAGAKLFAQPGEAELEINLTDPDAMKVADFWTPLIQEDVIANDPDFTDSWYRGLASGKYASWITAAWGPVFLQEAARETAGKWRAAPLPQWDPSRPAAGNWGGSTTAVLATSEFPVHAAEFARWINQEREPGLMLTREQSLFPPATSILQDPEFAEARSPFFGGQKVNELFGEINATVTKDFTWSPIHDFVISNGDDTFGAAIANKGDLSGGLRTWQAAVRRYAEQQGFSVDR